MCFEGSIFKKHFQFNLQCRDRSSRLDFEQFITQSLNIRTLKGNTLGNGRIHTIGGFLVIATLLIQPNVKRAPLRHFGNRPDQALGHGRVHYIGVCRQASHILANVLVGKVFATRILVHLKGNASHPQKCFARTRFHELQGTGLFLFKDGTEFCVVLENGPDFVGFSQLVPERHVRNPASKFASRHFLLLKGFAERLVYGEHGLTLKDKLRANALSIKGLEKSGPHKLRRPILLKGGLAIRSSL